MTNIHHYPQNRVRPQTLPRTPAPVLVPLSVEDRRQLERHLESCDVAREPLLAHVLRHKLDAPEPADGRVPRDTVAGGCTLRFRVDDGPVRSGLLCHRSRTCAGSGVIPVFSLLGATLIGMRIGQPAPLLCDGGSIATVTVLDIAHPA